MEMKKKYKIALISSCDLQSWETRSGTSFSILKALEQIAEIEIIDNLYPQGNAYNQIIKNWRFYLRYFVLKSTQIFWKFYGKRYQWERTQLLSKYYASIIEKKLHGKKFDFIFSDNGTIELANLNTDIPIIFLSDTTFHLMLDYYEGFSNLSNSSVRQGEYLEQQVIDKANLCIFLSQWARNSVISHYKADKSKVTVIPIGPNINKKLLPSFDDIKSKKHAQICELLLIGVDWERKGCDIAVNTVEKLNKMGISSHLTICGCEPPKGKRANKFTTVIPFLSKNDPKDMVEIISLFNKATYFIFPTRAECLGISLIEACAFGLPVLASDTGGVSEIVNDGENGFLFSFDDGAEKYAEKIANSFQDKELYRKMSLNAYQLYQNKFNWDEWTTCFLKKIEEKNIQASR